MSTADTARFARSLARLDRTARRLSACAPMIGGNDPVPFDEYVALLRLLLQGTRLPAHAPFAAGVAVVGRLEVTGSSPRVLIVGGLVEGDFPRPPATRTSFPDASDAPESADDLALSEDRYLLDRILSMSREQTLLFIPAADGDDELLPSHLLEEHGIDVAAAGEAEGLVPASSSGTYAAGARIVEIAQAGSGSNGKAVGSESGAMSCREREVLGNVAWNIAANAARRSENSLSALDGFLDDPGLLAVASERALRQTYSASVLDLVVQCPFRYFAQRVLGLAEPEQDEDGRMPMTVGLVTHSVLFEFYSRWVHEGRGPVTAVTRREAAERLADLVEAALARWPLSDFAADLALRRLIGFGGRKAFLDGPGGTEEAGAGDTVRGHLGLLGAFLDYEVRRYEDQGLLQPRYFEIGFGMSGPLGEEPQDEFSVRDPVTLDLGGLKIKVRGRADRVDADGQYYVLMDYKTGWKPGVTAQKEGWFVQLPLYLMAFEQVFAQKGLGLTAAGGVYYALGPDEARIDSHFLRDECKALIGLPRSRCMKPEAFQAAMDKVRERIAAGIERIRDGRFHVTLADEKMACRTCKLARICRKDLERARRLVPVAVG